MTHSAIAALTASFFEPFGQLGRNRDSDRDVVVLSWPAVPIEMIHACGLRAVLARSGTGPTPAAERRLEKGVFPARLHQLVEAALTGRLAHVAGIVIPRTSDVDYKCFLYLREFARRGIGGPYPPVILFDFLQSEGDSVSAYNRERARQLLDELAVWSGLHAVAEELDAAVNRANAARRAARRLQELRIRTPRLAGADALPVLGAFWQCPSLLYAELADSAVAALTTQLARNGTRVFLAGAPADSSILHAAVEVRQATVVDELGPFGRDAAGDEIPHCADMLAGLTQAYRLKPVSTRTPLARMRRRIEAALPDVDAVVFHQPVDDATFGWDYPWLREQLAARGIPHMIAAPDSHGLPLAQSKALDALLRGKVPGKATSHG